MRTIASTHNLRAIDPDTPPDFDYAAQCEKCDTWNGFTKADIHSSLLESGAGQMRWQCPCGEWRQVPTEQMRVFEFLARRAHSYIKRGAR